MKKTVLFVAFLALALVPGDVTAQGFGLALKAGSTGLGGDAAYTFSDKFGLRAGIGLLPFEVSVTETDTEYTATPPSPQFTVLADWFPTGGSFRLSGGLLITDDLDLEGTYDGYAVTGSVMLKKTQPYAGLGFGNITKGGLGFVLDLGVGFGDEPVVALSGPSEIQDELDKEAAELEEALTWFRFYPVLSLGLSFGIGGGG